MTTDGKPIENIEAISAQVAPVLRDAAAIEIRTVVDYEATSTFLKTIKGAMAKVEAELIEPWKRVKQNAETNRKKWDDMFMQPLLKAEKLCKDKLTAFSEEQKRIVAVEQARLQAEADRKARVERERAEAAARLQREKEAAAQRAADEARRQAAEATNKQERERLQREAEKQQAAASAAAAQAERKEDKAAAVVPAVVTVATAVPDIKGQSIRKTWKAVVVDASAVPREWLVVNETALQAFARATKGAVPVNGVRFEEVKSLASSSQ